MRKLNFLKNETESISTKTTLKNSHKLLAGFVALVLVAGMASPAYASLIGDTFHYKVSNQSGVICEDDAVVVDPGVEVPNCGGASIDVNADSIWFEVGPFEDGATINMLTFEFTDLDWVNSKGKIVGLEFFDVLTIPMNELSFGDHSITLSNESFIIDCEGPSFCLLEFHIDIETQHLIGGTTIPMSASSLLVAGIQANMGLWSLALVGLVGAGAAITYKIKSKKTEQ